MGRAPLFLTERLISQGGGLIFTALLVRTVDMAEAASFLAAFALAGVFQPMLSNAVQPLAARLLKSARAPGFLSLWALMP